MATTKRRSTTTLITSAAKGRTLDLEERNKRYLITMAVRMVLLGLVFVVPGWWKIVLLVLTAVIPVVAVALANHHQEPEIVAAAEPTSDRPALPPGDVIVGTTDDENGEAER